MDMKTKDELAKIVYRLIGARGLIGALAAQYDGAASLLTEEDNLQAHNAVEDMLSEIIDELIAISA